MCRSLSELVSWITYPLTFVIFEEREREGSRGGNFPSGAHFKTLGRDGRQM